MRGVSEGQIEVRLLVAEDDPTVLGLLSASLRFAGMAVSTAISGGSATVSRAKGCAGYVLGNSSPSTGGQS